MSKKRVESLNNCDNTFFAVRMRPSSAETPSLKRQVLQGTNQGRVTKRVTTANLTPAHVYNKTMDTKHQGP